MPGSRFAPSHRSAAPQLEVASIAHSCLRPQCKDPSCLQVTAGQPFRLKLLQAFAARTEDPDHNLHSLLADGVPVRILQDIPSSFQWQQRQTNLRDDNLDGTHLLRCQGNWTKAEQDPTLLKQLLQKEVQGRPNGTAIGKLNIVSAEGKDPRLVLDSAVCNASPLCKVPERVSLPVHLTCNALFCNRTRAAALSGFGRRSSTTTPSATLAPNSVHIGGNALAASFSASRIHYCNGTDIKHGSIPR